MGIDYSYEIGFGFAGTNEDPLPATFPDIEQWWDEEPDSLFAEHGLNKIGVYSGGDSMSGPFRWAVLLDRTYLRVSKYETPVITEFNAFSVTHDEIAELYKAARLLGVNEKILTWMFFCNVS